MKTIPVSLIFAGILAPAAGLAQNAPATTGAPQRGGEGEHGQQHPFMEFWKNADKDHDGFISRDEFELLPRVQKLPEEKRMNLFKRLDKDGDGKLSREELVHILKPGDGQGPPMQRLWELDVDKSGGISMEEFKAGRPFNKLPVEKQEALFHRLDTDGDGLITPKDRPQPLFRHEGGDRPFLKHGEKGPPGGPHVESRQIIRQLDKDGDGALSFEEFRSGPMEKDLTEDEQKKHFQALDRNHDLKITADDFTPPRNESNARPIPEVPTPADH